MAATAAQKTAYKKVNDAMKKHGIGRGEAMEKVGVNRGAFYNAKMAIEGKTDNAAVF